MSCKRGAWQARILMTRVGDHEDKPVSAVVTFELGTNQPRSHALSVLARQLLQVTGSLLESPAEDRSKPPPGYRVVGPQMGGVPGSGHWVAGERLADHFIGHMREACIARAWEHHDAIAKPAYERGRREAEQAQQLRGGR